MKQGLVTVVTLAVLAGAFAMAANDWKWPGAQPPPPAQGWCAEHKVALADCEVCNPEKARGGTVVSKEREPREGECPNTLVRIKLGPGVAERAGLALHEVAARPLEETLRGPAETSYVPSTWVKVAPRVAGVLRQVHVRPGQEVEAGARLATLESPDYGQAKADFLLALGQRDLKAGLLAQEQALAEKRISSGRELAEAKAAHEEALLAVRRAEQRLAACGLAPELVKEVETSRDTSPLFDVVSPQAGVLVAVSAVRGESAGPDRALFEVADPSRMWVTIRLPESAAAGAEPGQKASFEADGVPGRKFAGQVVAVDWAVDERTRTLAVHAEVRNSNGLLRAHMFGTGSVAVAAKEPKVRIPRAAVQDDGDCKLVFVNSSPGVYQARKVHLGASGRELVEVLGGLAPGEKIVTSGSFLLKGEVLRGEMGAG